MNSYTRTMPGNDEWTCPRCKRTFHDRYDVMRSRVGRFTERVDGDRTEYTLLCEDCHRDVVRR